ncbi:MAG: histidine phosphatase family protein [Actinomycetota bacterium]
MADYETASRPVRLLVIRHGESTWNARALWQGQADPPLSPRGKQQAYTAAEALVGAGIGRVVSSDLIRARKTAEIIAHRLKLDKVIMDEGFREVDVGEWSGLTRAQIEQRWPGLRAAWAENRLEATPGGELLSAFSDRVVQALLRTAATAATSGSKPALVLGHSRVLSALEARTGVRSHRQTHLCGRWFEFADAKLTAGAPVNLLDGSRERATH